MFDSKQETLGHIKRVQEISFQISEEIMKRGFEHDKSKLEEPEKTLFDEMTPKLKDSTYGSPEYFSYLEKLKPALDHHYRVNSHHPENHEKGFAGMTLIDIIETFCDWKSSSERHLSGDFKKSIEINATRFKMDPQLVQIFENTRKLLNL